VKLESDKLLCNIALSFNLRRYTVLPYSLHCRDSTKKQQGEDGPDGNNGPGAGAGKLPSRGKAGAG
jgi:hypothetical protein